MEIAELDDWAINHGFLNTLAELRKVNLKKIDASRLLKKRSDHIITYVAIDENKIIGTATLIIEQKFIHGGGKVAHFEDFVVSKKYRNSGTGSKLITHCINVAKTEKCYKMILNCDKNMKSYYKKYGFKKASVQMRLDLP